MKSKPKEADANPESTLIWRSYFKNDGKVIDLPPHALITSHGGTKSRPKRTHYALVCSSAQQLRLNWEIPFQPGSFRNASGLQRGVGSSQVTALLEPINFTEPKSSSYFANFTANLTGCYWVKLANPKKLDLSELATLNMLGPNQTRRGWTDVVTELRSGDFQHPSVSNLQSEIQFWSERV